VRLLLDTHTLLWWLFGDPQLSAKARALIADPGNTVLVSSASAWEVATKHRIGKLPEAGEAVRRFASLIREARMETLPIGIEHALQAGSFSMAHRDPFDRMLAAQSLIEGVPLVTQDPAFGAFGVETVW
jgi:PIN domain nuclease of toxin-antitoxin system